MTQHEYNAEIAAEALRWKEVHGMSDQDVARQLATEDRVLFESLKEGLKTQVFNSPWVRIDGKGHLLARDIDPICRALEDLAAHIRESNGQTTEASEF
jgi:hypothetical protein